MNSKTPFSLLAITILLASAAASPASVAQTIPEPVSSLEAPPVEVEPSAPALCTWMDAGLAEHAPASNGATFLAFGTGTAAILFQASTARGLPGQTGPMQGCPGTDAHPCPEALASDIAYAVLKNRVLCYQPTQDSTPTDEALVEGVCQLAVSFSIFAPSCQAPEPSGSETAQAEQECPIEEILSGLTSSMSAEIPCLEEVTLPCEEEACEVDPCNLVFPQASSTSIDCLPCQPVSECNPCSPASECVPCPNGDLEQCVGPVCEGGGTGCLTDPCSDQGVECPVCLTDLKDCDLVPCKGTNCVDVICYLLFTNEGCDVDPLECGGAGEPDCVTWVCSLFQTPEGPYENCGVSTCEDYSGNCIAFACDAALGNQDCKVPVPCGGSGQDDCLTWLCHSAGFETGDCDPVELIGPLVGFVVGAAVSCALGTPPPPGAPNCPFIIKQVKAIVDDSIASLWPLVNDIAKTVLDCANGASGPSACEDVRQASNDALQLVDELTLGALGLAQQCLAELRGTVGADSPLDCERLGEPGAAVQRYLDNVLLTFQEITAMAQACLDNAATSASCDAPCGEECMQDCDLCQPCGPDGCGPPIPLARQAPRPALAPSMGRSFEATLPDSGALPTPLGGDVDSDGIPDLLDAVNLPSEAQQWTGNDRLAVPQGLGQGGFLLLVEPSHMEAQLFLADTAPAAIESMDAGAALDILASKHGVELRNALATVLHENLTVHTTWVGIGAPIDQALTWSQTLPADGTWLMVRNDPTRVVSALHLGGLAAPVAAPATSHYTVLGLNDFRWEFLGLQGIAGFCFDAAGLHGLVPCNGSPEPEWLRAYSGQAAYALRSLVAGLEARLVPVATDIEIDLPSGVDSGQVNFRFPFPVTGPLPSGDFQDRYDVDDDGRITEPNGQADAVETYLYVDPDEFQAHGGDLFSGASAGWTLHAVPGTGQSALTVRVGDVWGTPGKELLVVQVADSLTATTVCVVRSGNGAAFYQAAASFRKDAVKPCGSVVPMWIRLNPVGELMGGTLAGWAMTDAAPRRPLFKILDADGNGLPESIQINIPDPNSCGADTHSCTLYTTFTIPLTDAAIPGAPEMPDVLPPPGPVYLGSPSQGNVDIFDPTSPLRLLGTESKRLNEGVGADYLLPMRGQGAPDVAVLQWPVPDGSSVSTAQPEARLFHFAGTYINMPAEPRDLVELSFLIQPADGNHEEQEFLLNGRILGSYLDVQSNETLVAQVDEAHRDGFTQRLVDVDVDGYMDLIVHIPHFSQVKLVVKNSDEAASASFWDVQLSGGPLTGWVSGSYGAVYRLDEGILRRETVVGLPSDQRTLGMSMVSDNEFYVVTTGSRDGWCGSGDASPSIAHYNNGFWSVMRLSQIGGGFNCNDLHDIWMNSAGTFGFAGGSEGLWLRYQNNQWLALPRGTSCGIMDIEFNASGVGYVAVAKADAENCPGTQGSPVMHWSGTAWSAQSVPASGPMYDVSPDGTYAVGFTNSVYSRSGTSWVKDYGAPQGSFLGVDRDSANDVWIAGVNQARCYTCTLVAVRSQGYWTSYDVNEGINHLRGLDMYGASVGAAVGNNALVIIQPPPRVDVYGTMSPSSGLTGTTFTGQDGGSTSNVAGPLTHQWSWGDGTHSTGATASHRYGSLGTKDITHTVTDSAGNTGQATHSVFIDAESLGTVSASTVVTATKSMQGGAAAETQHYKVTYSGFLWVRAELTAGDANLRLSGSVNNFVEGAGNWPYEGARERTLDGSVPNGGILYIAVEKPAGVAGGSFTLLLSEITPPSLSTKMTPGTTPSEVTYLDRVNFAVTWVSSDGIGPSSTPQVVLGGTPYTLLVPSGSLNFVSGVTYQYAMTVPPGSYKPIYKAMLGGQDHTDFGEPLTVTYAGIIHDFADDAIGNIPEGFNPTTPAGKCCNYWHVENSNDEKFPSTVQIGLHGNVAWFAHKARGDYNSGSSQPVAGALETPTYDLRLITRPLLSFASYYELEDLGSADKMTVRINHRNPVAGSWSGWQDPHSIQGYEGGYKQWRTQTIDLSAYGNELVKVQFLFEASGTDNGFLGWMIDDVTIGHDHDDDKLPDLLERTRNDILVTPDPAIVQIPDGGTARSYVRRLNRPMASSLALDAVVASPDPSKLKVSLGARDSLAGTEVIKIIHDGAPTGNCFASPPGFIGPVAPGASVVEVTGGGLIIHINALTCGLQVPRNADWFLEVKDKQSGDALSYIESLRAVSIGKTDYTYKDTDSDGASDGSEVSTSLDALGYDVDQDGVPSRNDVDDLVPNWAPAIKVASKDYQTKLRVEFQDPVAPIVFAKAHVKVNATNEQRELARTTSKDGSLSYNPSQHGTRPDVIVVEWQDAYGTKGKVTYFMAQATSQATSYRPAAMSWQATDPTTGQTIVASGALPSSWSTAQFQELTASGFVVNPGSIAATGFAFVTMLTTLSRVTVVGAVLAGIGYLWVEGTQSEQIVNSAVTITYSDAMVHSIAADGALAPTVAQIEDVMRTGTRIPPFGDETRFVKDFGGGMVVILITLGAGSVVSLRDGYRLQDYGGPSQLPTIGKMLQWERLWAVLTYGVITAEAYWAMPITSRADFNDCEVPVLITLDSSGDLELGLQREEETFLPKCIHDAWVEAMQSVKTVEQYINATGFTDNGIAQAIMGQSSERASKGFFDGGLFWYWDDVPNNADTGVNCDQPWTWAHPDIRRCSQYDTAELQSIDWIDVAVEFVKGEPVTFIEDQLAVAQLNWTQTGRPVKYEDGLAGKGTVMDFQKHDFGGKEILKGYQDSMEFIDEAPQASDLDAMVKVPYHVRTSGSEFYINIQNLT